jgi:putative ABC transport system substrate-binding protein
MRKSAWLLLIPLLVLWGGPARAYNVDIHLLVEHPALNASVDGFRDALAESGQEFNFKVYNAQNDVSIAQQIVTQIIGDAPDLILTVATMSSQQTVNKIKEIPILFTAVTDPVTAQLVESMERPGGNVTGTTDMTPLGEQLALIKRIQPDVKTVGVIYNPGEVNSQVQVEIIRKAAAGMGLALQEAVADNNDKVYSAVTSLVGKVDAIFLPTDNTVISSYETIVKVAVERKIPLYCAEAGSIRKSGTASLSLSYYELGRQTAAMALRILAGGAKPADMPVETQEKFDLVINAAFNAKIGLEVPQAVLDQASEIVTEEAK